MDLTRYNRTKLFFWEKKTQDLRSDDDDDLSE